MRCGAGCGGGLGMLCAWCGAVESSVRCGALCGVVLCGVVIGAL